MSVRYCVICEKVLGDATPTVVVKEDGLETLAAASLVRKDGKVLSFKRVTSLHVHVKCRKSYINERMIAAAFKRLEQEKNGSARSSRSESHPFNFRSSCFLCAEEIPEDYDVIQRRRSVDKRNPVYYIKMPELKYEILDLARKWNDEFSQGIVHRLESIIDLKAVGGMYHKQCLNILKTRGLNTGPKGSVKRGRPSDATEVDMTPIYEYLENHDEECQFTADELMKEWKGTELPTWRTVKAHLIQKYGEDICITDRKPPTVCFKNTGYKILNESWYQKKKSSEKDERRRIIETAAAIIAEDIRSQAYETTEYPPPHDFMKNAEDMVPESLRVFTESLIMNKKRGSLSKWKIKSTAIAHALIAAVRPSSFVSPVQVGVAAFLYKKFGSRILIDILSALGFCSSYTEAVRCEISCAVGPPIAVDNCNVLQCVFDNADYNVQTIDGHNTVHVMGGILCVNPKSAIVPAERFPRLMKLPSATETAVKGGIPLQPFHKCNNSGLADVKIKPVGENFAQDKIIVPTLPDLLWLYGKSKDLPDIGGWNGFMEEVTKALPYETTFVCCLPFINAPSSDYDTVHTSLILAMEKSKALGQVSTIVTFDQPLYLKAREIVASCPEKFKHVVVRLGGFHLAMSFMGAIGYVMEGSGLVELFNQIYAVNSTTKIMTGHSYARAIRAHYLAHRTLAHLILQTMTDISPELHQSVEELLDGDRQKILTSSTADQLKELSDTFGAKLLELSERGKTAQLWIQYFQQVTLLKQLIESERKGDWDLHLRTIYNMLPYFHSSGHFLYAKCAHLYLQDMLGLEITMPADEYVNFTGGGAFTVRRSDKLWCGTFTDQTIEQFLMRSTKIEGGFRMRNISDSISFRWLQGHTSMVHISEEMEKFSGVHFVNSEQHVDSRDSRVQRDHMDCIKMLKWLEGHYPFTDTKQLISISTGIVGDDSINCHQARDLGEEGVARIVGKDFNSVKFKRNERVKQLSMMHSGVKVHDNEVIVNSTTLYHRMIIVKQSEEELKEFLNYELSPYPTSLFEEGSMRKGTKSSLYKAFNPLPESGIPKETVHVIDGGFLLHRVVWSKNQTFNQICDSYVRYLRHHYNKPIVIFDGYPENSKGTKQLERARRATKKHSVEVVFAREMIPNASQEHFLGNEKNKSRFITILMETLTAAQIPAKQAEEDADRLIVTTAIEISPVFQTVTVVGEDVDLIVLLVGLSAPENVFFLKPGRGKSPSHWYYPNKLVHERISQNILFLHAVTGCDTTSSLYGQGKAKSLKVLEKRPELSVALQSFKTPFQDCQLDTTLSTGEKFIAAVYGDQHGNVTLNEMRYQLYKSAVFKSSTHLESLPPTQDAARQHLLRVYLQIQLWLGHKQEPENFGWKKTPNGLEPIKTTLPPAPDTLLSIIACKCKKGCSSKACGCKKAGLFCSRLCLNCEDTTCSNIELNIPDDDFDNDDELNPQSSSTGKFISLL